MKNEFVNSSSPPKKEWEKPALSILAIKKDTFSGTGTKIEKNAGAGQPNRKP